MLFFFFNMYIHHQIQNFPCAIIFLPRWNITSLANISICRFIYNIEWPPVGNKGISHELLSLFQESAQNIPKASGINPKENPFNIIQIMNGYEFNSANIFMSWKINILFNEASAELNRINVNLSTNENIRTIGRMKKFIICFIQHRRRSNRTLIPLCFTPYIKDKLKLGVKPSRLHSDCLRVRYTQGYARARLRGTQSAYNQECTAHITKNARPCNITSIEYHVTNNPPIKWQGST